MNSEINNWRKGVGIFLLNIENKVFIGERIDNLGAWQMPQGGIEEGESIRLAAERELLEETGISNTEFIAESQKWYSYKIPKEIRSKLWNGRFIGQRQKWFAMRFKGLKEEINLKYSNKPEFRACQWVEPCSAVKLIVPFKRKLYKKIISEFSKFL